MDVFFLTPDQQKQLKEIKETMGFINQSIQWCFTPKELQFEKQNASTMY